MKLNGPKPVGGQLRMASPSFFPLERCLVLKQPHFDPRLDCHYIEVSSLTGDNVESPFALAARSVLLAIESGSLDPEKAGSGVSYGDRSLRRVSSGSRLSVTLGISEGRKRGLLGRGGKCC